MCHFNLHIHVHVQGTLLDLIYYLFVFIKNESCLCLSSLSVSASVPGRSPSTGSTLWPNNLLFSSITASRITANVGNTTYWKHENIIKYIKLFYGKKQFSINSMVFTFQMTIKLNIFWDHSTLPMCFLDRF